MDELQIWNRIGKHECDELPRLMIRYAAHFFMQLILPYLQISELAPGCWYGFSRRGCDLLLEIIASMINMDDSSWVNSLPVSFIKNEDETS